MPKFASLALALLLTPVLLHADTFLNFPRLSADPAAFTGVAIVNPTSSEASVTITAYGSDGSILSGDGVTNPVSVTVPAGQQFSKLTYELFGSIPATSAAWFQASSPTDGLTGFFLFLNPSISLMDGADVPVSAQKLFFNDIRIDSGFSTELNLVNPGSTDAHLSLRLAGTLFPHDPQSLTLPAHGAARLDAPSFFGVSELLPGAYVSVSADADIAGFEIVQSPGADAFALNARRGAEKLGSLYFLQLSVLGSFDTQIGLVNYSADPVVLTLTAYKPDGSLYTAPTIKNNPVTRALNGQASLHEDLQSMFGFSGDSPLDGWILVKSTSDAVNGFVSYGDSSSGALAAVTSSSQGRNRALFSHIATASGLSTVLSLLNPGSITANVRILALDKSGRILGVFDTVLRPSERFSRFLGSSDLIPQAANQVGGLLFIKSDQPVYISCLIRSAEAWVNIPAQSAPDSYNPDSAISTLKMSPPIAIVPPGASQRFSVSGSSDSLSWKVNGTAGGSAATGTISPSGVFTAPNSVPARQVVTITAETSSQSAGASADVLDKVPFTSGLGIIQSVAYLDTLGKVYSAELAALGSAPSIPLQATQTGNSQIFEVPSSGKNISVALFPNEVISKIIPFTADNGTQFLLLAAQTSGRIIRLNPVSKDFKYIVTGLNQPSSIVIDPSSGDLLIVEADKISSVPKAVLQGDFFAPDLIRSDSPGTVVSPFAATVVPAIGGAGITVDRCTGFIYYSIPDQGAVVEYHPSIGTSLVVASGLDNPGQLLGIYRENVTCPKSFQILVAERNANRVTLVIPHDGIVVQWVEAPGIADIAFQPRSASSANDAVLLADHTAESGGIVYLVLLSNLYESNPPNPPEKVQVEPKVDLVVKQSHGPDTVSVNDTLTFTATVINKGPDRATGVSLTDTLPAGATFLSATASQGNCGQAGALVNCNLGAIPVDGSASVTVKVSPDYFPDLTPHTLSNTAVASSIEVETAPADNTSTNDAVVSPLPATSLALSGLAASVPSATPTSFVVTVKDRLGHIAVGYTGTIHFTSSDSGAILPHDYAFSTSTAGTATLVVIFRTPGLQTITATDVSAPSVTATISTTVSPARAASLVLSAGTTNVSAGVPFSLTVTVKDETGNNAVGYTGTVAFSSSDASAAKVLPPDYTFAPGENGVHTFAGGFTLTETGSKTITVTDAVNPVVSDTLTLTVTANEVASLQVSTAPGGVTAGTTTTVTVTARDAFGNTLIGYTGPVTLSASPAYHGTPAETFTPGTPTGNGVFTFAATLYLAGSRTINASGAGTPGASGSTVITVIPGPASSFAVAAPTPATAGGAFIVTVTAKDSGGNIATGYSGTVHFTSSDGAATLPADSTFANGVGTFAITLRTAGSHTVAVGDTAASTVAGSAALTVNPGSAASFDVSAPTLVTSGAAFAVTVTARDSSGNTATGYSGTVRFTSSDGAAALPANSTLTSGSSTFSVTLRTAGPQTVTSTDTLAPSITGTSAPVTVSAGATTQLVFEGMPATAEAGVAFSGVSISTRDAFNNPTSYSGTAGITASDAGDGVSFPSSVAITNGRSTAFSVTFVTAGSRTLRASATGVGGESRAVAVSPAATSSFRITLPSTVIAGDEDVPGTIRSVDAYGNNTSISVTVSLTTSDPRGVFSEQEYHAPYLINLTGGRANFSISFRTIANQTVTGTYSGPPVISGTSGNVAVVAGLTAKLVFSGLSESGVAPVVFSNVTAITTDSYKNPTNWSGTVFLSSSDPLATFPGSLSFSNGATTPFSVTFRTAGEQTIRVIPAPPENISGRTPEVEVSGGAATHLRLSQPGPAQQGQPCTLVVDALDLFNNLAGSFEDSDEVFRGTITFSDTGGYGRETVNGILMSLFSYRYLRDDASTKSFTVYLDGSTVGQTVSVASPGLTGATLTVR